MNALSQAMPQPAARQNTLAQSNDPADVGSNTLAQRIITGLTSLAAATALTLLPTTGRAQESNSTEAY